MKDKSTIWQEELRKHLDNATPTEDWRKSVEQDDRVIQFDNGELLAEHEKLHEQAKAKYNVAEDMHVNAKMKATKLIMERATENPEEAKALIQSIGLPDLDEESKRSDRFFGMRLNGKSIDDIENKFLAMFAEFVSLMALFIGMLGFGVLLWAIFG
jgi:hypothetical protein